MALAADAKGKSTVCSICGRVMEGQFCTGCAFDLVFDSTGGATGASEAPQLTPSVFSELPAELSHYVIDRDEHGRAVELGRGGMGVTFRGMDTHLHIPVAIKVINSQALESTAARERFLREARLAARVRHQNIASSLHLGRSGDRWYYVMELATGETLDALVRREGPLRSSDVLEVGRQVALALGEAERMKLVHRDIKPLNLMVDRSAGRIAVKVIDFGLVKSLDAEPGDPGLTEMGWVGTVNYASPEQLRQQPVDIRSDFYSLGLSLWFALRGKGPLNGSRADVIAGHLAGIDLEQSPHPILNSLLALKPEDRPANATALEALLREELSASASGVRHLSVAESTPSRLRLGRWGWAALAAVLAFVGGAAVLRWRSESRPPAPPAAAAVSELKSEAPLQEGEQGLGPDELVERARGFYLEYSEGKNDRAIALLLRALQLNPEHSPARAALADAYAQRYLRFDYGREWLNKAADEAERVVKSNPEGAAGYAALGLVRYSQGRLKEAWTLQNRAAQLASDDPRNCRNLAITQRERGELREALKWATRACELDDKNSMNWSIRGSIHKRLGEDEEAIKAYERSAHFNLAVPEPLLGLAHVHLLRGELDRAEECVERANRAGHRELPETCSMQAQIALARGKVVEAEGWLRKAVKSSPGGNPHHFGNIRYKGLLGYVLSRRGGALDEAQGLLAEAQKLDEAEVSAGTENPVFHYSLAATLAALGQADAARERLARARELGWNDDRTTQLDLRLRRVATTGTR